MKPRHAQLPIWRDANRLLIEIERAVRKFPRYHKYALGSDLRRLAMEVCRCIVRAAPEGGRERELDRLQEFLRQGSVGAGLPAKKLVAAKAAPTGGELVAGKPAPTGACWSRPMPGTQKRERACPRKPRTRRTRKLNPNNPLWRDAFVGAALAATDRAVDGVAIAAKAAPTKTMPQLGGRLISLMNYLGFKVEAV